ncbi:MAG: HNH endonuclease [Calditrichaeota bacterium]|nr:HNH endonuclease [Calditrichota bacterium]
MKFWVGVTDNNWFSFLAREKPDEVNFWQPSASPPFKNASVGMPFLFKLKKPYRHIGGGGYFVTYSQLPIGVAWDIFGPKNGCSSSEDLRRLIKPLASKSRNPGLIGCTVLANPFFFEREDWIAQPAEWGNSIVVGKYFDTGEPVGQRLWNETSMRLDAMNAGLTSARWPAGKAIETTEKYGKPTLVRPRMGQSSFRVMVTEAYERRCAITGESTLVALEAAHIVPYSGDGSHEVSNGLLLRADFHRLYDEGLVAVTPQMTIRVSPRIREAWFNGKVYYALDGKTLSVVPTQPTLRPDPDRLDWHVKNRFQA